MTLKTDIDQLAVDAGLMHDIIHGDSASTVTTDGGEVPTVAKALADAQASATVNGVVVALADGATIACDISLGTIFDVTLGGNRTLNFSGGSADIDGKKIMLRVRQDATGSRTLTLGTGVRWSADIPSITLSTGASKLDRIAVEYCHADGKYDVIGYTLGF